MSRTASFEPSGPPPLLTVDVPPGAPKIAHTEDLLAALVYPLTVQSFMSCGYRERCVALRGGGVGRMSSILGSLCGGSVPALVRETASDEVHCWFKQSGFAGGGSRILSSVKLADPLQVMTAYAAGASLYMRSPKEMHDLYLPALSDCLGMAWAGYYDDCQQTPTGEIEVFVSHPGHTTGWHTDFMENFTVQLRGMKRWRLRRSRVPGAPRGITPHFKVSSDVIEQQVKLQRIRDPDFEFRPAWAVERALGLQQDPEECVVDLSPGDVLYFPAGMWHMVEALPCADGHTSLSVNFSLVSPSWADTASSAVRHMLWGDDDWRRMVSVSPLGLLTSSARSRTSEEIRLESASATEPALNLTAQKRLRERRFRGTTEPSTSIGASSSAAARAFDERAWPRSMRTAGTLAGLPVAALTGCHVQPLTSGLGGGGGGVYECLEVMLTRLRAAVSQLRPEHLLPPSALLSTRFSDLRAFNEEWALQRGFSLTVYSGVSVVTVLPEECWSSVLSAGMVRRLPESSSDLATQYSVNPLAVMFPASALCPLLEEEAASRSASSDDGLGDSGDSVNPADDTLEVNPPVPPGYTAWLVHVNCGSFPDMASQTRTILHIPTSSTMSAACHVPLRLEVTAARVARLTSQSCGRAGDPLPCVDLSQLVSAANTGKGSRESAAVKCSAVCSLVCALAYCGVLCDQAES